MTLHDHGFVWGPLDVTRLAILKRGKSETHVLGVTTEHHKVEVAVSKTGRSVRVWINGEEVAA